MRNGPGSLVSEPGPFQRSLLRRMRSSCRSVATHDGNRQERSLLFGVAPLLGFACSEGFPQACVAGVIKIEFVEDLEDGALELHVVLEVAGQLSTSIFRRIWKRTSLRTLFLDAVVSRTL